MVLKEFCRDDAYGSLHRRLTSKGYTETRQHDRDLQPGQFAVSRHKVTSFMNGRAYFYVAWREPLA